MLHQLIEASEGLIKLVSVAPELPGPLATLVDGTIAGSGTDLMSRMVKAASFGLPLADAVRSAAVNPAQAIGVFDRVGSLDIGKQANAAVLDKDPELKAVFFNGTLI